MSTADSSTNPKFNSSFLIQKNASHVMVKAVRSKVERLYKVNIKFGEQDACGQWVHIQGDLIDRRNAKMYISAVCNPTSCSIVKLPEPLFNKCIEQIESHTNAVIKQVGRLGQYKVSGSSCSMALALSILNDVKESGVFGTPASGVWSASGKAVKTDKTSKLDEKHVNCDISDKTEAQNSVAKVDKNMNNLSESVKTAADEIKDLTSMDKNENPANHSAEPNVKYAKNSSEDTSKVTDLKPQKALQSKALSKNLFAQENLTETEEAMLENNEPLKESLGKQSDSTACCSLQIDHKSTKTPSESHKMTEDENQSSDKCKTEICASKGENSSTELSSFVPVESMSDSLEAAETRTFAPENLHHNEEIVLDTSLSFENISFSCDVLRSKKKSRASKRLSMSLISVLNASNARMDNCLEAPDTVKRAILSCLESEETNDVMDDSVILVDNDEEENKCVDISQIVISDDDDDDNDVTVITLDDTVVEVNNNESEKEKCADEEGDKCCANVAARTTETESVEQLGEVISNTNSEISDDLASCKSVEGNNDRNIDTTAMSSGGNKKDEENSETVNKLDENLVTKFTALRNKNRKTTEKCVTLKENVDTNTQNNTVMVTIEFSDTNDEISDCNNSYNSNKMIKGTKKIASDVVSLPDGKTLEEGEILESDSGDGNLESQKVGTVGERKKRKSGNEAESKDDSSKTKKIKLSKINHKDLPGRYRTPYYNKNESKVKKMKQQDKQKNKSDESNGNGNTENKKKKKKRRKRKVDIIEIPSQSSEDSDKFSKKVRKAEVTRTPEVSHKYDRDVARTADKDDDVGRQLVPRTPMTPYLIGQSSLATREKRYIVIDGSNVAMAHGNNKVFSCRGILLAVGYFRKRGHDLITVFLPQWRKCRAENPSLMTEQYLLDKLEREGYLVFTPSRRIGRKLVASYDDRFILELAEREDGVVVSNDNFRDLKTEKWSWRRIIEERLLMYSFARDHFMVPEDPLGRHGPTLDRFLRH